MKEGSACNTTLYPMLPLVINFLFFYSRDVSTTEMKSIVKQTIVKGNYHSAALILTKYNIKLINSK